MGAVAKSYMRKGFLIYEEMRKYLVVYEEAVSHEWLCNRSLNFFSFLSVYIIGKNNDLYTIEVIRKYMYSVQAS